MSDFATPRITEKRYLAIPPTALTADGTVDGLITIASTYCFKVGQCVLFKQGATHFLVKIQEVSSETQFTVIDKDKSVTTHDKLDMSSFLTGATVELKESKRPVIDLLEIQRQVYEEEPTIALRSHLVDYLGRSYTDDNPLPINISDLTLDAHLNVQLDHKDDSPNPGDIADSVRVGDGVSEMKVHPTNYSLSANTYEKLLPMLINANWLNLSNYEEVQSSFGGNLATISYFRNSFCIARAFYTFTSDTNWSFKLEAYINDDDGDVLLDDNDLPLFLD